MFKVDVECSIEIDLCYVDEVYLIGLVNLGYKCLSIGV